MSIHMPEIKTFETRGKAAQYVAERGYFYGSRAWNTEFWRKGYDTAEIEFTPGEAAPWVVTFHEA